MASFEDGASHAIICSGTQQLLGLPAGPGRVPFHAQNIRGRNPAKSHKPHLEVRPATQKSGC